MSRLKHNRERLNLTQQELATKSGVSVRTIQRIESGIEPKGYTLKALSKTLDVDHEELIKTIDTQSPIHHQIDHIKDNIVHPINYSIIKLINLSSLPVSFIPPLNIFIPLIVMFITKEFNTTSKQLISVQIIWTLLSAILFMVCSFLKNWFFLSSKFILIIMLLLVLTNIAIILLNAAAIDRDRKLAVKLKFNFL